MSAPHFEFWSMNRNGEILIKEPVKCRTVTGLILQCHPACNTDQIRHLAEIAQETPNYPVDLSAWIGTPENRSLTWNARIFYRS